MASNAFEKKIQIIVDGFENLREAQSGTEEWQKAVDGLSQALVDLEKSSAKMGENASGGARKLSEEMQEVKKAADEANKALRELVEIDINKGGTGDPSKLVGKLSPDEILSAVRWGNYSTADTVSSNKQAEKSFEDLRRSVERLSNAYEDSKKAIPQAGQSRMETALNNEKTATEALAKARWDYMQMLGSGTATQDQTIAAHNQIAKAQVDASKATSQLEKESERAINTLPRLRYALYDVSRTLTRMGAGMLGAATSVGVVSTKMSRDFADVIRTTETFRDVTGQSTAAMKRDFEELYKSTPSDWGDITRIGEMAGQMGIASQDVAEFSNVVSRMAASTDMSVDATTTTIGRLAELLNVSAEEYENLSSSIISVGVNSIATETQIAEISQQIAGIAGTAGLSADEVVGLSSALASIGTAPELSRGIVTRFFTNLMEATSQGGERLEKFAAVSGMTADQFKTAWGQDAAGAFQAVIQGLGQVEESEAINVLKELGIQQVRDIPAVLKLSQNYGLLAQSMGIAADGYSNASALAEHSGVVYEEMSSKIVMLKNQFALLLDALGQFTQSDLMKGLVDGITRVLELLTALANNPVVAEMIKWGVVITGVVGAVSLLGAALTAAIASHAGLKTALVGLNTTLNSTKTATELARLGVVGLGAEMWKTDAAAKVLRGTLATFGVGAAIAAVTVAFAKMTENAQKAKDIVSSFSNLGDAIRLDAEAFREAEEAGEDVSKSFREIPIAAEEGAPGVVELSEHMQKILGITGDVADGMGNLADETDRATIALGENFKMAIIEAIVGNEELIEMLNGVDENLAEAGFTAAEFAESLTKGNAAEYLDRVSESARDFAQSQREALDYSTDDQVGLEEELRKITDRAEEAERQIGMFREMVNETEDSISTAGLQTELLGVLMDDLGMTAEEAADALDAAGGAAEGFRSILSDFDTTAHDLQGTFYDLAEAVIQNGGAFDEFSVEGRNSVKALESALDDLWVAADGDAQVFAANVAEAFAYVEGAGYNLTDSIDVLDQVLDAAFGTEWRAHLDTSQAHQSIASYLQAVEAALRARAELERQAAAQAGASAQASFFDLTGALQYKAQEAQHLANERAIQQQISSVQGLAANLGQASQAGERAGRRIHDSLSPRGGSKSAGRGAKDAQKAAKDLKEELYTLSDYASDLSSIWDRAFDIRFSGQQTIDSVTTSTRDMAKRFEEAENRVKDLKIQLQILKGDLSGVQAELSKQQYFLSIAMEYGDTARAEQIQARITELQAELASKQKEVADTSKDVKKAQDDTSRSLEGNSDAAIKNRADLMGLLSEYQDHIKALAESGMGSKELQQETNRLRNDFVKQATQLGFNKRELDKYTRGFNDVRVAINKVPRKITVRASMSPAQQAVNEWIARTNKRKASMTVNAKVSKPRSLGSIGGGQYQPSSIYSRGSLSAASISSRSTTTHPGGVYRVYRELGGFANPYGPIYRASGGPAEWASQFAKGTDTIPAMLTPGEYVIQKKAADFYGPEVMQALNNMKVPKRFFSASGNMQGGAQASGMLSNGQRVTVDLSPSSVQAVAQAVQPVLKVGNETIAQANGASNKRASTTGAL